MPRMASPSTRTPTDEAHEAEVAQQAEIAAAVEPEAPAADPAPDEAPVAQEARKVTLRSVEANVDEYPLSVSVVGAEDELVFDSASTTVEVSPEVAEQVTYLTNVEVVA